MSKEFEVLVLYTDGSSIDGKSRHDTGSGSGIHGYGYDVAPTEQAKAIYGAEKVGNILVDAVYVQELPELIGDIEYIKRPKNQCKLPAISINELDLTRIESSHPIKGGTSQIGELQAFINVFNALSATAKKYIIHTDSTYLLQGYTEWMTNWKRNGWTNSSGQVKNKELWKAIWAIKERIEADNIKLEIKKIKGHSDRYGNDQADLQAGKASAKAINMSMEDARPEEFKPEVVIEPYKVELDASEEVVEDTKGGKKAKAKAKAGPAKPKKVKDEEKFIPKLLRQKYHYVMSDGSESMIDVGDETYYRYFGGDHAKMKDDRLLLGKAQPDNMQVLTFMKESVPILSDLAVEVSNRMWGDTPMMYRSNLVLLMNGTFMNQEKFNRRFLDDYSFDDLPYNKAYNELLYDEKHWISVACRPPGLSYRAMDLADTITGWYIDFVKSGRKSSDTVTVLDITDKLYNEKMQVTDWYRRIDKSIRVPVPVPGNPEKEVDVIFSRNITFPDRTLFTKLTKDNPKVYVIARKASDHAFRYYVIIESDAGNQLICSYHSSLRIYE